MNANFSPLLIGSFPHKDIDYIANLVLDDLKDYPMWVQLPNRTFYESMYVQYSEGLPFVNINIDDKKIFFSNPENEPEELLDFYSKVEENDIENFKITEKFSAGLYKFAELKEKIIANNPKAVKGHTTGPFSFALTVTDENKRASWFDVNLRDIIKTGLKMKALWQIGFLKKIKKEVIFFIDEPYLASIGSGVMSINRDEVAETIYSFIDEIKAEYPDVKIAIHCCGNTDWSIILDSPADILSYDSYNYGKSLLLYKDKLAKFLEKGGAIAWGAVPTSEEIESISIDELKSKITELLDEAKNICKTRKVSDFSFISPACGTGSLSEKTAEKILSMTSILSDEMKKIYGE